MSYQCVRCGDDVDERRYKLGYHTCLFCGEEEARNYKHTVAIPYNKGAYQYISNSEELKMTNPKRTI